MLNTTRTSNRLARKRKVAMIVDESSDEEEEPPKKKQKITKKAAAPKKVNNRKKRKAESDDDEEDISDADVPRKNSKKKATADSDDESEPDYDDESAEDADDWAVLKPGKKTDFAELKATALKKLLASADTGAYQSLGEEEYTLPDELLLQIFGHFTRKQLHIVGLACRQWLRLSNDQSLGWHLATSVVLKENAWQYFEYFKAGDVTRSSINNLSEEAKVATLKQYKDHFLEERPSMPTAVAVTNHKTHLVDEHGTVVRHVAAVTPILELNHFRFFPLDWVQLNSDPELWSYRITKASVEEVQTVLGYEDYKNLETQNDQWVVDIEINIKRLEDLVTKHDTGYTIDSYSYYQYNGEKESAIPGMKLIYSLVEQDFLQRITSISSSKFSFIPRRSFTAQQQPDGFKDEMKLYKYQLDAISWMKSVEDNKDGLPYFTAYPWRRARTELLFDLQPERKTVVTDLEKYVDVVQPKGAVLADEMGLGKTLEMIGLILSSPAPTKLPKHRALITSRATLVLCPNHLVMQWSDELTKSTNLKVAVAATIIQLKKFTYQDFIDYDVVIASYQLLENPKYFFLESNQKKRSSIRQHEEAERSEWVESSLKETKRNKQGMKKKCPILEHFYWHRMVLDEGHEYLAKPYFNYIISTSFSRFAWYVTGTPFPTLDHFKYVKRFIGVQSGFKQYTQQQETLMTDLMLRELYWRHTKASVQGEYKIPDYVEDLVLVEFDEIEKVLYADERKEADQSHMCGSLLQSSTLDSRLDELIHRKRRCIEDDAQRGVPGAISALAGAQRFFDNEKDAFKKEVAFTVLEKRKKELVEAKATQEHNKKVLELALKVTPFAKRDKKNLNEHSKLIGQHGTKLVQMIVYLKKLFARKPDSRVIFFSQFEDTLTNVSQILSEYDVPNVFVEGNIWKRTKALNNFKKDEDVKVIMLSLKNAASGTNLVAATHVILMDPVTGSKKEAQAIESQAIGRAFRQGQTKQITIVRFVVRNTIEHALYLRNNDVNEDTTVVMTKDNKPQLVKTASLTSLVATNSTLQRSGSFARPLEENNTNVMPSNNNNNIMED